MSQDDIQRYHEIALTVMSTDVDPVANYIIENICGGLLLEDEDNDSHTTIKFYVANGMPVNDKLAGLLTYLADVNAAYTNIEIQQRYIKNLEWIEAYQKAAVPVTVGDSIVIKAPWHTEEFPGRLEIIIEPKMAFGTGRHESTRGTLIEMEPIDFTGKRVLDLGCGSGILSIYAAKKGAMEVIGYDIDPLSIENSAENFLINGVDDVCHAARGTLTHVPVGRTFDVIAVNIIKAVILPILEDLKRRLSSGGILLLSGLLEQDKEEIEQALADHQLNSYNSRVENGWLTYTVKYT